MKELAKRIGASIVFILATMIGGYIFAMGNDISIVQGAIYIGVIMILAEQSFEQ
jgi:hypothetical protein